MEYGYLSTPPLSEFNKEFAIGIKSWKKLDICPACGSKSVSKFATIKKMPYSRCHDCGLKFANPIPSNDITKAFYNSSFYANYRRLEENRIAHEKYFSISINADTMEYLGKWIGDDKSVKILDYGCGPGSFLALLRDKFGFSNIEGIELNNDSIRVAKRNYGLNINSSIQELHFKSYDYIVLLEVIEHISEPDTFLSYITKLLKPGGRLLISTPAIDNPIGYLLPSHASAPYSAPCHVSLFTKKSITILLSRFNFNIERLEILPCWDLIEKIITSIFYDLDFLSPRTDEDFNDCLYTPTSLGRIIGFKPQRNLSSKFWAALRITDDLILKFLNIYPNFIQKNGHIYVIARYNK